jgi:hypothetical protein
VLGATDNVKFGGEVTVSSADVLIPSDATVMVEVPTAIPVANPVALIVAIVVSLLANVRGPPAMELPYWSLGVAVNCCVTPTCTDAGCGVSVIDDKERRAGAVEAGVGLPPQLTHKRKIRARGARDISFHCFSMVAKVVAPVTVPFRHHFAMPTKEQCNRHASFRIALRLKLPGPVQC